MPSSEQLFQILTADIEGNAALREPQRQAHRAIREHFETSTEHAILQIPVGCGKTGIMATLPFGVSRGRVLIITPNVQIRAGVASELDITNPKCFLRAAQVLSDLSSGPYLATLDGIDANVHDCDASHYVVTNIQQLASSADRWLPRFAPDYFDMILVDEGHHNVAPSWTKVFERFPRAKVVSLTATPFRADGLRPEGKIVYRYPFTKAMVNGYIKQIHWRNVAPAKLSFSFGDDGTSHTLEEVLQLREEAWFRRSVALSPECNSHIVATSLTYLRLLRDRTGYKHQLIASACSVDHARQVRALYEQEGFTATEIFSEMDEDEKRRILDDLRAKRLDCIVQVAMLGEGFDHPPLSVAAMFRPFRSLSAYIQFVGRAMRVIHQRKPQHLDNHAFVVSHVGLNNDAHWEDFRELDFDDQQMVRRWLGDESDGEDGSEDGGPRPRRFDQLQLVENEIVGEFISKSFLDPEDDRVLDELLAREIGGGLRVCDLISREDLRKRVREHQRDQEVAVVPQPVQPQRRRVAARKRLPERTRSVAARVVDDLGLSVNGREIGAWNKAAAGQDNLAAVVQLLNRRVNGFLSIGSGQRGEIGADAAERALAELDRLGDEVRDALRPRRQDG
jgi:superfamily II DNA or RNA helicase